VRSSTKRPKHNPFVFISIGRAQTNWPAIGRNNQRNQLGPRVERYGCGGECVFSRGMEINSARRGVRQRRRQPSKTALPSLTNRASALGADQYSRQPPQWSIFRRLPRTTLPPMLWPNNAFHCCPRDQRDQMKSGVFLFKLQRCVFHCCVLLQL